ncbi:MAG TPA: response regulator [Candidatus Acidoferrum sp.]|nr:response regulator [Candidatus Acidoferrum sp.]
MNPPRSARKAPATLIYVVDDEQLLLDLADVALRGQGYQLKKFNDPADAFAAFTSEPRKPSLLLTDYAMAPLNGLELSERCKAAHPDLKILMVSGTVTEEIARGSSVRLDGFIAKPYQPSTLADTVRALLYA